MTEMEQLEKNDVLVSLAMAMQQYGVRTVLENFKQHYPLFFQEIEVQLPRVGKKPIAVLLRKTNTAVKAEGGSDAHSM